ncbi:MAG: 6-bladed beta-propeller [Paraprevotella sp.]|nr:6-bladed beta-propeller [Paraprevotella sp.]
MKKEFIYIIVSMAIIACRNANVTEIKPYAQNLAESAEALQVKDQYPSMELVTDKAIHLPVMEESTDNVTNIKTNIHYLPLETTEECLIGHIDKLVSDDSCLFVFDQTNQSILRFSQKDGSFLNKIGSKGRGPGEFIEVIDVSLNRKKKEICLIDFSLFKLMFFDYNGRLIQEKPLYYVYNGMEFLDNRIILHTGFNENTMAPSVNNNRLVLAEMDQTPLCVGFAFPENLKANFHHGVRHDFVTCDGDVYYNHVLSDTIWQIKEDGICEAKYVIKFPNRDNLYNEEDFKNITDNDFEERQKSTPHYQNNFIITKDFVKVSAFDENHSQKLLYCISTGHRTNNLFHKIFGKPTDIGTIEFTLNDETFVDVIQPFEILKDFQFYKNNFNEMQYTNFLNTQLTEEERQLLNNMTEEDNPILMIMDIEPF